ncbi:MAG: glycosyltransferase family 2 protein [Clostridiales Family XIII bacterium]|jgi:glycosyltransferase involved in cell wall biosynthesis|nr:glycosyltransferase family 2 protein [Clostridiales Family XIII bacterium]
MKLSICWITKNEEFNISRSIQSYRENADELIVVDTGSTDNTIEAARSLGATVAEFEWIGDFAAARNYALSLATGDIIMCPDADMWFDPPFSKAERADIEAALSRPDIDAVFGTIVDVEDATGIVMNEAPLVIAFKNSPDLKYTGPIHERIAHLDGSNPDSHFLSNIRIFHSGYSEAVLRQKAGRNIDLLNKAAKIEEEQLGGAHTPLTDFYIMRENLAEDSIDIAFDSFMRLHKNPRSVAALKPFVAIATTYFYIGLRIGSLARERVSRADIYNNLVLLMKKLYPGFSGSESIDLLYQLVFDMRYDVFLDGFEKIWRSFNPKAQNSNSDSVRAFAEISMNAALICWRLGKLDLAFDYAIARLKCSDVFEMDAFTILLSCVKGQPESEIVVFLSSLFDCSVPIKAHTLAEGLHHQGFQTVFKYFVMKQLELGTASKKHFLTLLLLNGNYSEAISNALSMEGACDPALISDTVFLALFCSGDDGLYQQHSGRLDPACNEMMKCCRSGEMARSISLFKPQLISAYYSQIAFIAGIPKALRFLYLFRLYPDVCFTIESKYYIENSMYADVMHSEYFYEMSPGTLNDQLVFASLLRTGNFGQAFEHVASRIEKHGADQMLLNQLLSVAIAGDRDTAAEARKLHEYHFYLFNEYIDMGDVARTGITFDNTAKRDKKRLSELSAEDFSREIAADAYTTSRPEYLGALSDAAKVYEKNGLHAMAAHCYTRLCACGHDPSITSAALARVFKKLNNKGLSNYMMQISEAGGMPQPGMAGPVLTPENSRAAFPSKARRLN